MAHQEVHPLGPFDVTLLVKDGKEFKAHRHVLSEVSPFFKNLLQSDMKENKEGVIRLETFTELLMKEILGFIYTGDVQILSEDQATELIKAGDFLFLSNLKTIASRFLERSMTTSNCISTYYFAKTYRCDELATRAKTFIQTNFAIVAKSEEFLNLTSQEVEEWISSDEIVISAEEDVFNIILEWIEKDQETRNEKFEELFRHVRLMFTSRDFLRKDVVTNKLVQQHESCMKRVTQAINLNDKSTYTESPSLKPPRKTFESDALVVYGENSVACYLPAEDKWFQLPEICTSEEDWCHTVVLHVGKLHAFTHYLHKTALCYDPLCNKWNALDWPNPSDYTDKDEMQGYARYLTVNDQIYAVVSTYIHQTRNNRCELMKYNITSHSWQVLPSSFLVQKEGMCVVAFNRYIQKIADMLNLEIDNFTDQPLLNDAARFDTVTNTWGEIAPIQEARRTAFGAAANENVFIAGGTGEGYKLLNSCEMYTETTDEWHFIASLTVPRYCGSMVCVAGTLYVLGGFTEHTNLRDELFGYAGCRRPILRYSVECYDCDKDKWYKKTTLPRLATSSEKFRSVLYHGCSARLFKGFLKARSAKRRAVDDCYVT